MLISKGMPIAVSACPKVKENLTEEERWRLEEDWKNYNDFFNTLDFAKEEKPLAAICAAPLVLGNRGLLQGKKATCYPGFETYLQGADYTAALVEKDGNIITGKGPGAAMEFAFAIVEKYCGIGKVDELKQGMMIQA